MIGLIGSVDILGKAKAWPCSGWPDLFESSGNERICRGGACPKAVQIRRGWTAGEPKRLDFCVLQVCLAVQVVLGAVLKGERKMQRQLAVMQADQGWWSFKRCIQPGLQIAVDKELLA